MTDQHDTISSDDAVCIDLRGMWTDDEVWALLGHPLPLVQCWHKDDFAAQVASLVSGCNSHVMP